MAGKVLGETWRIYKERFGIMVFFAFLFSGLGSVLLSALTQAANYPTNGYYYDMILRVVEWIKGVPWAQFGRSFGQIYPFGMDSGGKGLWILALMGINILSIAYSIFAGPMNTGGLTVLSTGERGPLTWRDVFNGLKHRYWKLVVTTLCYMVYGMAAGFVIMMIFTISLFVIFPAMMFTSAATDVSTVFLAAGITLSVLLLLAAALVVNVLAVFIFPAAIFDRQYYFKALGRSITLAWKHFFEVVWVRLLVWLITLLASALLFGFFFAIAWSGPNVPVYFPLWLLCSATLVSPFSIIVNGVLYRHFVEKDVRAGETAEA